jgi:uncharacterized protein YdhG (YjbR/CyaY superfamily)
MLSHVSGRARRSFKGSMRKSKTINPGTKDSPKDIDEYIAGFPADVQAMLEKIRRTIKKAAPDAEETIKYQMPTFALKGNLIHFAVFKKHIGLYPVPRGVEEFKNRLSAYEGEKSTLRLPLDKPIPTPLISDIVKFLVKRNLNARETKRKKR